MANYPSSNTSKRGRTSSKLSVRLFLLDPEKEITKATKEIGSEKAIKQLMQKGCGPPRPEHCANEDKVEFSLELTNGQFKQKIIGIYPNLENACFVFMKVGKDNKLEELNPGRCCFRCYSPENVYHSERGQGRLYIRKIAENEISQCTHGESPFKRMCAAAGGYIPIQVKAESSQPAQSTANTIPQSHLQSSTIAGTEVTPPARSFVNMITQNQLPLSTIVSKIASTPPVYSPANVVPQTQLPSTIHGTDSRPPLFSTNAMTTPGHALSPSGLWTVPTTTVVPSVTMGTIFQSPSSTVVSTNAITTRGPSISSSTLWTVPTTTVAPSVTMGTLFPSSSTTVFSKNAITTPGPSISSSGLWTVPTTMVPSVTMATFPATPSPSTTVFNTDAMTTPGPSLSPNVPWTATIVPSVTMATSSLLPMAVSRSMSSPLNFSSMTMTPQGSNIVPGNNFGISSDLLQADVNTGESSTTRGNEVLSNNGLLQTALLLLQSSGRLNTLEDAAVERGPLREMLTNDTRNWTTPLVQENLKITEPESSNTEVQWTKRSIKHGSKLSEFVELLKTNPSKAKRIGTYRVCFDDKFSIGKGSDGTKVYVGLSDDGYEVAVKCMDLEKCRQMGDNEKRILNCPNVRKEKHIVNYRFYQPIDSEKAYLVLDLHEESLRDYILNNECSAELFRKEGLSIIRQILYGVSALHCGDPEILHRDLKPSNILVTVEGEMVLADFGISRTLPEEQTTYKSGVSGTEGWMAVESLPNEDDDDDYLSYEDIQVRYKKQSDIQVVGMLCYYVLTKGKHPYGPRIHRNSNILKGNFDLKDLSDPRAKDLITWMLQHDPGKRPNVHKCLKHPYLRTAEENFKFVTCVGNEKEIKTKDATSIVVQELNKLPGLTNWLSMIERCVMDHMTAPRRTPYTNDAADLLRFIRNMAIHWCDKTPPVSVQNTVVTPQEYFERKYPTLAVELHRVIRKHSDWTTREGLKGYF